MATVTQLAKKNQTPTYRCLSLRLNTVIIILIPKITQIIVNKTSKGHSSSAYSLETVMPNNKVTAAKTIKNCQPQK